MSNVYQLVKMGDGKLDHSFSLKHENIPSYDACYIDTDSILSIDKLVNGKIDGIADLLKAEQFIRMVIFHDNIKPLSPSAKIQSYTGESNKPFKYISGKQLKVNTNTSDFMRRVSTGSHLGNVCSIFTFPEHREKAIINAQGDSLKYICAGMDTFLNDYLGSDPSYLNSFIRGSQTTNLPVYFTSNTLLEHCERLNNIGLVKHYLNKIDESWAKFDDPLINSIGFNFQPFISIVLSRADKREDIFSEILSLKEELSSGAKKLWFEIDEALQRNNQDPIMAAKILNRVQKDAESIFPKSIYTNENRMFINLKFFGKLITTIGSCITSNVEPKQIYNLLSDIPGLSSTTSFSISKQLDNTFSSIEWHKITKHLEDSELSRISQPTPLFSDDMH